MSRGPLAGEAEQRDADVVLRARNLARVHLADALPRRWRHVQAVAGTAEQMAHETGVAPEKVVPAAWLHDIGYAPVVVDTGFHPLDGARLLRDAGWPPSICALVAHHTCARVEARVRGLAAELTGEFCDTEGIERDIVWAADALTGPDGRRFTLEERVADVLMRYGDTHPVARCMRTIEPELAAAIARVQTAGWMPA